MSKNVESPKQDPGALKRALRPTPPFFRKVRKFGTVLLAASGAIAAVASGGLLLPAVVTAAAGYMAAVGAATVAVSQMAVEPE